MSLAPPLFSKTLCCRHLAALESFAGKFLLAFLRGIFPGGEADGSAGPCWGPKQLGQHDAMQQLNCKVVQDSVPDDEHMLTVGPASQGSVGWWVQVGAQVLGYGSQGTMVYEGSLHGRTVAVKRMLRHLYHLAKKEIDALILSDEVSQPSLCFSTSPSS